MSYLTNFTTETGKTILCEIIKTVNQPENSKTISMAKSSAGKEMIAMMQLVFPLVMKIQMEVITNFGFPGNLYTSFTKSTFSVEFHFSRFIEKTSSNF